MSCTSCKKFLSDFLETGIHRDLPLAKRIRPQTIPRVLDELTDWIYRVYSMIPPNEFDKAIFASSYIARRDRTQIEYEYIIHTARFNFLKIRVPCLSSEIDYINTILLEKGFLKSANASTLYLYDYIGYTTARAIIELQSLHREHEESLFKTKSEFVETKEEGDDLYS